MAEEQKTGCSPSDCAGCSHAGECGSKPQSLIKPENKKSHINHVIAVVSGKGGVGKSMVTASLARLMREQGFSVGIMDADITGPTIPKMYGIHDTAKGSDDGIFPEIAKDGTKIMSVNLLLPNESDPVIWRAPIITSVVTQFWTDVIWGDLDYLFVDMPPGTGDVPLTVFQTLPVDGIVVVTSPQDLVSMIVEKAVNMAKMMDIPVIGIVENMSYFKCPDCGNIHYIYGKSNIDKVAEDMGIKNVAKMPIDPHVAEYIDAGRAEEPDASALDTIFKDI